MTDPIRHPALTEAIESAIGLNVDCGGTQGVHRVRDAVLDAIQPELDALAALRQVARGYCPECGRGDAAPTVEDWEQQRQRADQAEELLRIANDTSNKSEAARGRAAATLERVRNAAALHRKGLISTAELHAVIGPAPGPAATQATDASWLLAGSRDLSIPAQHHFTAHPVTPQMERAATERARQAASDSERAAAWIAEQNGPTAAEQRAEQLAAGIRNIIADMHGVTGARHWIAALERILDQP